MTTRNTVRMASLVLALALTIPAAGCDWLDPSGTSSRVSPVIDALTILPSIVSCGERIGISFEYSDPQDDIRLMQLVFQHTQRNERLEKTVFWDDPTLNLGVSGLASYSEFFFPCFGPSAGEWTVTVRLEDDRGHQSNELEGSITLD